MANQNFANTAGFRSAGHICTMYNIQHKIRGEKIISCSHKNLLINRLISRNGKHPPICYLPNSNIISLLITKFCLSKIVLYHMVCLKEHPYCMYILYIVARIHTHACTRTHTNTKLWLSFKHLFLSA